MPQKFTVHGQSGGLGHGKGGRLVVPTLLREGNLDPVDDGLTINLCSRVNNGPSESSPQSGGHEVVLKENSHIEGQEVDRLADT